MPAIALFHAAAALVVAAAARTPVAELPALGHGVCIDRQMRAFPPDPAMRISRDDLRLIRKMGFDFAKVIVNPAVVQVGAAVNEPCAAYLDQVIGWAANENLPVVVCIHPEPEFKRTVLASSDAFDRFEAFMGAFAGRLASRWPPRQVAFQLMTEPFGASANREDWNHWDRLQHRLWRSVRRSMPKHLLVLSGDQVGTVEGLHSITPVQDEHVLYSFTIYDPGVFTQQGGPWLDGGMPYLTRLPYPSRPETMAELPRILAAVPPEWHHDIRTRVEHYAAEKWDRDRLASRIAVAARWRDAHPGTRLWCAEFGCYEAAAPDDRLRYLGDLVSLFEQNRIGWAYWSYNESFTTMTRDRAPFGPARAQTPDADLLRTLMPVR